MTYKQSLAVSKFNSATVQLVEQFGLGADEALEIQNIAQQMIYKSEAGNGIKGA